MISAAAAEIIEAKAGGHNVPGNPRSAVTRYVAGRKFDEGTVPEFGAADLRFLTSLASGHQH